MKFEAWPIEPEVLKSGSSLALVWHLDVSHDTTFWSATQPIYDVFFPRTSATDTGWLVDSVSRYGEALRGSQAFAEPGETRRAWEKTYSGDDYLKRFFGAIAETIDRAGGTVHRKYETVLLLARRR